jgi:glycosyltransferase involved in cell wall biosynthesis
MSFLSQITVLILTYNEAPNIRRTLEALTAFDDVLVLDSGSTDETFAIVKTYPNARLMVRAFDTHASQWNHGLAACHRPWVLALDADYIVSKTLISSMTQLSPSEAVGGYKVTFGYCIFGRRLSASLYPPAVVLFRRERSVYVQIGHTQRLKVAGSIEPLTGVIDHDDRKPLARWIASQIQYAKLEADYLVSVPSPSLSRARRIRRVGWPAPILVFFSTLIVKRCIFDGWAGWLYVMQRVLAEVLLAIEIVDRQLRQQPRD